MMLDEANKRLKNEITEEQLWGINSLYILLDLHKDDFCKIVDLVGIEKLMNALILPKENWQQRNVMLSLRRVWRKLKWKKLTWRNM